MILFSRVVRLKKKRDVCVCMGVMELEKVLDKIGVIERDGLFCVHEFIEPGYALPN